MMDSGGVLNEELEQLPPGFRFHPTDEELITYYLTHKISEVNFGARAIAEVDLTKCEPWDLPGTKYIFISRFNGSLSSGLRFKTCMYSFLDSGMLIDDGHYSGYFLA